MPVLDLETLQQELEKFKKESQESMRQQLEALRADIAGDLATQIRINNLFVQGRSPSRGRQISGATSHDLSRQGSPRSEASDPLLKEESKEAPSMFEEDLATKSLLLEKRRSSGVDLEESDLEGCCGCIVWLVTHPNFDHLSLLLVSLNVVCLAVQTDYMARHFLSEPPQTFLILNHVFCGLFLTEIALRMTSFGCKNFFCNKVTRFWNVFDFIVVLMFAFEVITLDLHGKDTGWVLRVTRIFQIARVARAARFLQLFPQVRTLLVQILHSFTPLLWVFILVFAVTLIFATILTQVVTEFKVHAKDEYNDMEGELKELHMFDNLPLSMLALYQTISDGKHWGELSEPLMEIQPWLALLFVAYTFFVIFAFMNVVTSQFVEQALESARHDEKQQTIEKLEDIFALTKRPGKQQEDVEISESQFLNLCARSDMMRDYLQQLYNRKDVTAEEVEQERLFQILDVDGSGSVSTQELVMGCERLSRQPTVLDLASFRVMCVDFFQGLEKKLDEHAKKIVGNGSNHSPTNGAIRKSARKATWGRKGDFGGRSRSPSPKDREATPNGIQPEVVVKCKQTVSNGQHSGEVDLDEKAGSKGTRHWPAARELTRHSPSETAGASPLNWLNGVR